MFNANADEFTCKMGSSTFLIRIHFNQNADWQGVVQWLELNKTVPFRSVLELILLLNEAVEKTPAINGGQDFRSWGDLMSEGRCIDDFTQS